MPYTNKEEHQPLGEQQLTDFLQALADPAHRSGGGVAAAVSLAGAAAVAELVFSLAERRKSLRDHREEIGELRSKISRLRDEMFAAAEKDMAAFSDLMDAQADVKRASTDTERQTAEQRASEALLRAAETPISVSLDGLHLIRLVHRGLPFANRFTISDLGAAASIANGAIEAALLTVDVNLSYMEPDQAGELLRRVASVRTEAATLTSQILKASGEAIGVAERKESPLGDHT